MLSKPQYYQLQYLPSTINLNILKNTVKLNKVEAFLFYRTSHSQVTMATQGTLLHAFDYRETMGKMEYNALVMMMPKLLKVIHVLR
jgi:hypothetical protein